MSDEKLIDNPFFIGSEDRYEHCENVLILCKKDDSVDEKYIKKYNG